MQSKTFVLKTRQAEFCVTVRVSNVVEIGNLERNPKLGWMRSDLCNWLWCELDKGDFN